MSDSKMTDGSLEVSSWEKVITPSEQIDLDLRGLTTTSSKIRYLNALGWSRGDIARKVSQIVGHDIRYQHVRNVLVKPQKRVRQ